MGNINFGIDLGTTNSGIGSYKNGKANLLKNPVGFRETLPSVVSFRNERILIGDKANEQLLTDPENVFSSFKRKMGTSESYSVKALNKDITPVELSTYILKELSNFSIHDKVDAAVITIPASFDTIQSNATKTAGYEAGFEEVVLLQEPIAACLAYANTNDLDIVEEKKWLVYDFGGGTFDVAIVNVNERELKVIDHKGNNFLGGLDVDLKIMSQIVIPKLAQESGEADLLSKIDFNGESQYRKLGKYLLYKTEEVKKELSLKEEAWLEVNFPELNMNIELKITRSEINSVIKPLYDESFVLLQELLDENSLLFSDFERIILVGGTTYIPFIRESLQDSTGLVIDTSVDPTTAVIVGATYYAGNKPRANKIKETEHVTSDNLGAINVSLSYENLTKDDEELIAFKVEGQFNGFYRIHRNDGGFDTGMVEFTNQANEFVSLLVKQSNQFTLSIFDSNQNSLYVNSDITISHGFYNVNGQPLPNDICIELDEEHETYLEQIFKKNTILPLKKTIYKTFSKSIAKGSDDKVVINIVEGRAGSLPGANLNIGYVEIYGKDLQDDLIRGTDIELSFSISESRDLSVEIYIPSSEQEIVETFNPQYQNEIGTEKLLEELNKGVTIVDDQLREYESTDDYEQLGFLTKLKNELGDLKGSVLLFNDGIVTDNKYQLMERKRKLLYQIDKMIFLQGVTDEVEEYQRNKEYLLTKKDSFPPALHKDFENVIKNEAAFLQSGDKFLIRRKIKVFERINQTLFMENDESYYTIFFNLKMMGPDAYTKYSKVEKLLVEGEKAFEKNEIKKLKAVCQLIFTYLRPDKKRDNKFSGTGLK